MLAQVPEKVVGDPVYLEKDYTTDDAFIERVRTALVDRREPSLSIEGVALGNSNKSRGRAAGRSTSSGCSTTQGVAADAPAVTTDDRGRRCLADDAVRIRTTGSAGQSYGVFCNDGMTSNTPAPRTTASARASAAARIVVRAPGGGGADAAATC